LFIWQRHSVFRTVSTKDLSTVPGSKACTTITLKFLLTENIIRDLIYLKVKWFLTENVTDKNLNELQTTFTSISIVLIQEA
jgi:N-acetylmuramoyl-L-alanine amidase CwlA